MASNKIQELPSIKYDQEQLIPEVIERKKWNLIYIVLCVVGIFLSILFSQGVDKIEAQKLKIAQAAVAYCEYKPKVEKLKQIGQTLNVGELVLSQFMLENLFFIDAQPYEIIHSIKRFFESEQTKTLVGSFNLTSVILNIDGRSVSEKEANSVSLNNMDTIPIKIEGKFASYTDLSSMISVLKKMTPIITITDIEFNSNNSVSFRGNVYNFQKNLFLYTYGDSYKEVNNILLAKEKYQKNKAILIEILKDKDLGLDKMGVAEIYDWLKSPLHSSLTPLTPSPAERGSAGNSSLKGGNSSKSSSSDSKSAAPSLQERAGGEALSYAERKELQKKIRKAQRAVDESEAKIAKLEARKSELDELLMAPENASNMELVTEYTNLQRKLDEENERWMVLSEELETLNIEL